MVGRAKAMSPWNQRLGFQINSKGDVDTGLQLPGAWFRFRFAVFHIRLPYGGGSGRWRESFGLKASWGQDIGVAGFVRAFFEVANFYPAFGDQGFKTIVYFAETDAESFGEGTLWEIGIGLKAFEKIIDNIVVELGHGGCELAFMGFGLGVQIVNLNFNTYSIENTRIFLGIPGAVYSPYLPS